MPFAEAVLGGLLIGASALLLFGALGRIAGISGITFGLVWGGPAERWRPWFIAGLALGGWLAVLAGASLPRVPLAGAADALRYAAAGVLVGLGTRWANGCTSGHGICGLARLSPRSLAAVAAFMATGMLCATLWRSL